LQYRLQARGETRWVSAFGTVVGHDGDYRLIGISIDSTEMRKTEEALRQAARMESIGRLAGGVAHDYNNLLSGILGGASLIAEMLPAGHSVLPLLDLVIRSSERAALLTKQLLAYSGRGAFLLRPVDLSKVVEDAFILLRASLPSNVILSLRTERDLPPIEADESQLADAVVNLVTNAAEAIGEVSGRIDARTGLETLTPASVTARFSEDLVPGPYVFLEVRDSGVGMPPEVRDRIFEPFFTTKFMGRGLGLAALQGIVRGHRGGTEVKSEPGQGSTFRLYFPAAPAQEPQSKARRPGAELR
ncbi:MAG: ATP-binding protein, partial [Acidobacteriota bacterium]|nr:ATP-binding protein [Acidobacteriota bacterium]